jgi:hypothetical protein
VVAEATWRFHLHDDGLAPIAAGDNVTEAARAVHKAGAVGRVYPLAVAPASLLAATGARHVRIPSSVTYIATYTHAHIHTYTR